MPSRFPLAGPSAEALYWAYGDRVRFGFYHAPIQQPPRGAILICPPLGLEYTRSYRSLRSVAERLAAHGYAVFRFDYGGTGNSAGETAGLEQPVQTWCEDISAAAAELRTRSGVSEVDVLGLRVGATIAAWTCSRGLQVRSLILWAPFVKGRAFVREQRAGHTLIWNSRRPEAAEAMRSMQVDPELELREGDHEYQGFLYTAAMERELDSVDLAKAARCEAQRIIVIPRDDIAEDDSVGRVLAAKGTPVERMELPGYANMMADVFEVPPASFATDLAQKLTQVSSSASVWGGSSPVHAGPSAVALEPSGRPRTSHLDHAQGYEEIPVTIDGQLFGILTLPRVDAGALKPVIVIPNTANNHNAGPSRMWVPLTRRLAGQGFPSLRFDLRGLGDSVESTNPGGKQSYPATALAEVRMAVDFAVANTARKGAVCVGLCSGAYHSILAAMVGTPVVGVVGVSLPGLWKGAFTIVDGRALIEEDAPPTAYTPRLFRRILSDREQRARLIASVLSGQIRPSTILLKASARVRTVFADLAQRLADVRGRLTGKTSDEHEMALALRRIVAQGMHVRLYYDKYDEFLLQIWSACEKCLKELLLGRDFELVTVAGADHSFSPVRAQRWVLREIERHIIEQYGAS